MGPEIESHKEGSFRKNVFSQNKYLVQGRQIRSSIPFLCAENWRGISFST
jgi:hypothetical protein